MTLALSTHTVSHMESYFNRNTQNASRTLHVPVHYTVHYTVALIWDFTPHKEHLLISSNNTWPSVHLPFEGILQVNAGKLPRKRGSDWRLKPLISLEKVCTLLGGPEWPFTDKTAALQTDAVDEWDIKIHSRKRWRRIQPAAHRCIIGVCTACHCDSFWTMDDHNR